MLSQSLLVISSLVSLALGQYVLPTSGTASTTQFLMEEEFGSGTSCGQHAFPGGAKGNGKPGGGPGLLYAAINQLAFGANPSGGAGGPGAACGLCYQLTPMGSSGKPMNQSMTFMITDECPVAANLQRGSPTNCNQCSISDKNSMGQTFHFDIAVDAMNAEQYKQFHDGATYGANWLEVKFQQVSCTTKNPVPPIKPWGCVGGCKNNNAAAVCAGI